MTDRKVVIVKDGYDSLFRILCQALDQAQQGKGKERHAVNEQFEQQEICLNTRAVGYGYPLGQARKKVRESLRLLENQGVDAAQDELLGAINYIAAAYLVMGELKDVNETDFVESKERRSQLLETCCSKCGAQLEMLIGGKVRCSFCKQKEQEAWE